MKGYIVVVQSMVVLYNDIDQMGKEGERLSTEIQALTTDVRNESFLTALHRLP